MTQQYTPAQLEDWAGLGPWEWAPNSDGEFECPRRVSDGQWIVTSRLNHSLSALSESHRDALTAAPDLARLVLEKDAEIARLKKFLSELEADCEADYPPSHGAIKYAIRQAMKETSDE